MPSDASGVPSCGSCSTCPERPLAVRVRRLLDLPTQLCWTVIEKDNCSHSFDVYVRPNLRTGSFWVLVGCRTNLLCRPSSVSRISKYTKLSSHAAASSSRLGRHPLLRTRLVDRRPLSTGPTNPKQIPPPPRVSSSAVRLSLSTQGPGCVFGNGDGLREARYLP